MTPTTPAARFHRYCSRSSCSIRSSKAPWLGSCIDPSRSGRAAAKPVQDAPAAFGSINRSMRIFSSGTGFSPSRTRAMLSRTWFTSQRIIW